MPSDIIAELPVTDAAINLVIDISELPINAAIMTSFEPDAIFCPQNISATISHVNQSLSIFSSSELVMGCIKFAPGTLILRSNIYLEIDKKIKAFDTSRLLKIILITRE
jgi:hypothetical protein